MKLNLSQSFYDALSKSDSELFSNYSELTSQEFLETLPTLDDLVQEYERGIGLLPAKYWIGQRSNEGIHDYAVLNKESLDDVLKKYLERMEFCSFLDSTKKSAHIFMDNYEFKWGRNKSASGKRKSPLIVYSLPRLFVIRAVHEDAHQHLSETTGKLIKNIERYIKEKTGGVLGRLNYSRLLKVAKKIHELEESFADTLQGGAIDYALSKLLETEAKTANNALKQIWLLPDEEIRVWLEGRCELHINPEILLKNIKRHKEKTLDQLRAELEDSKVYYLSHMDSHPYELFRASLHLNGGRTFVETATKFFTGLVKDYSANNLGSMKPLNRNISAFQESVLRGNGKARSKAAEF